MTYIPSNNPGSSSAGQRIEDGASTNLATVAAFHNADNQALAGTAFGLLTGGVAQLLDASGNLDRQRETGADVIPNIGVATGTQQVAWPVAVGPVTSGAITGSAVAQTITLTAVAGTTRGVAWAISVGQALVIEPNTATQEAFTITAINSGAKTVTGIIRNNHAITAGATAFFYDQARSGMIPDGSSGQGIAAGGTYLFNSLLNANAGGWEGERSAAGELDGASGTGTAIAAEYEFNSGGPGSGNFDRARNLQGKGIVTGTLNGAANSGQATAVLNAGPVPAAGQPVYFQGGTAEVGYVLSVASQTLTLTANLANTHGNGTNVQWDAYAGPIGPGLSGFLPTGVGIEEECLFDPVSSLYYVERSATQDTVSGQNVVMENNALLNAAGTLDRAREGQIIGSELTSLVPATATVQNSSTTTAAGAQIVGTIPAVATKLGYLLGFDITLGPGTAGAVTAVTANLASVLSYTVATVAADVRIASIRFPVPIPATAVNTAITVTVPAVGGGSAVNAVTVYGFTN